MQADLQAINKFDIVKISVCGLICNDCQFYDKECQGCYQVNGKPFWAAEATEKGICELYDCSINKKAFNSCRECNDLPCKIFFELKDPSISDAEHQKSIKQRVKNLNAK